MRHHDLELANEVLEPTFVFMRSQTDRARLGIKELGEYLQYREKDVGKAYVALTSQESPGIPLPRTSANGPSQASVGTDALLDGAAAFSLGAGIAEAARAELLQTHLHSERHI